MPDLANVKDDLLYVVHQLEEKRELSGKVGPDYYEPGKMEFLDKYLGIYDEQSNTITLRTDVKGLRYEDRTPRLDSLAVGDIIQLVREPDNDYNENNITVLSERGDNLGNLPADLCDVISPLMDLGYAVIKNAHASYIERISERSRYARQGVLFIEFQIVMMGI